MAVEDGKKTNQERGNVKMWFYFTTNHGTQKDGRYSNTYLDAGQRDAQQAHHGAHGHDHGKGDWQHP